jgi:hypothetical protein
MKYELAVTINRPPKEVFLFLSTITKYEPYEYLEEEFCSKGMKGHLAYQFIDDNKSTKLIQRERIFFSFPLNLLNLLIRNVIIITICIFDGRKILFIIEFYTQHLDLVQQKALL